jgi:alpha-amylase
LSAWLGNTIQHAAMDAIYALEAGVKASGDAALLDTWRRLQTSDHFYYMCTKYWSDGDVHKYFSPYDSPYEAYRRYSHALEDLRMKLRDRETGKGPDFAKATSGKQRGKGNRKKAVQATTRRERLRISSRKRT